MLPVLECEGIQMIRNPRRTGGGESWLSREESTAVRRFHESMDGYAPTPLCRLSALAEKLGVKAFCVKDESRRFGLKAFKGLGGSYALFRVVCQELGLDPATSSMETLRQEQYRDRISRMVFITATDGNHGKGVAWAAGLLGCKSHVYMPKGSVEVRAQAIRDAGQAEVTITDLGYDDTVRLARDIAEKNGWHLVQDTSWPGYETVPRFIVQAYTTMAYEALDQLEALGYEQPSHVFLQAGVGSMAGCVLGCLRCSFPGEGPVVSIVEPTECACVFESARQNDGLTHPAAGSEQTIMAGLNCAEVCSLVWPLLRHQADYYFACPDGVTAHGMRTLAKPLGADPVLVSGESGAVTTGLAALLLEREGLATMKKELGLDENSVILVFSTEGDTDPEGYRQVVEKGGYPF